VIGAFAIAIITGLGREARGEDWTEMEQFSRAAETTTEHR
jgi:hypothetical protein